MKNSQQNLTPLETALQRQFKADENSFGKLIKKAYLETAKMQGANIAAMLGFGLLAMSIRPRIGHGKFGTWLADALGGKLSKSTAYSWIKAAEWLAAKIGNADRQTDIVAERICAFIKTARITNGAEEIFADAKLTADFIAHIAADLPFKTFLNILKSANAAAIEAEAEEAKAEEAAAKKLSRRDRAALENADGGRQLTFFDELFDEVRASVEVKREDPRFLEMDKDELAELGNYLLKQGREILEIAKQK